MKHHPFHKRIVELLTDREDAALSPNEIARALKLRGKNLKKLQKWLHELTADGDIVRIRHDRYGLGREADLVTGRLAVLRSGDGIVTSADGRTQLHVPERDLETALPADTVVARLNPEVRVAGRPTGKVIRVVNRERREIVGTLRATRRFLYVVPVDPSYRQDIYVPAANGAAQNDRVVVRLAGWENRHVSPEGEIVEVLGPADRPSLDTTAVMRHYGLPNRFPAPVMREAEGASARMERPGSRRDLRDRFVLTIDPARARDFDDALSLETGPNGERVLGVHIADVAHFVPPGSALDAEARRRGNSVYLPDHVVPMLPEQLSNRICSLKPGEDRLAFSVFLTVSAAGSVRAAEFARTTIRSRVRLTYEQVLAVLSDGGSAAATELPGETVDRLRALSRLAQQFRRRRFARHALELDVPEPEISLNRDGSVSGIRLVTDDISHQLVEECMVAANEAVARRLAERRVPLIYRVHEPPAEEKIEALSAELAELGYEPGDLRNRRNLADFVRSVKDDPLAYHVRVAVLRSMKRALYSSLPGKHFGLAKSCYAHFTSPIRRYPDLVVHRQLAADLAGEHPRCYTRDDLDEIAPSCSRTEWTADEAERSIIEIKKYRFLDAQLRRKRPLAYEAAVVKVMNFGLFVEVLDLQLQGLVHVSALSDRFVRYRPRSRALQAGRKTYKRGDRLSVIVSNVDFDKRRVDFALADRATIPS